MNTSGDDAAIRRVVLVGQARDSLSATEARLVDLRALVEDMLKRAEEGDETAVAGDVETALALQLLLTRIDFTRAEVRYGINRFEANAER